jgi:hypothetical protein
VVCNAVGAMVEVGESSFCSKYRPFKSEAWSADAYSIINYSLSPNHVTYYMKAAKSLNGRAFKELVLIRFKILASLNGLLWVY